MPLIKDTDIATLRKYVKMNFTATAVKSMPDLDAAERKFLIPILTQPVFDALQSQVDTNTITWTILLNICRAAAAPLAVWLDLPFMQAQISDRGLSSDDNAAHQWEYVKISNALADKGMAAMEDLLEHLLSNAETYTWVNTASTDRFIRTGTEFHRYVFLHQPQLTFLQLVPLMREVEDHYIKTAIGETFFNELRIKAVPGDEEKVAIELLKKALAQYTVVRAIERMPVKITPNGLMASIQNDSQSANPEKPAENSALERLFQSSHREAESYQRQLMEYLNKNATLTLFKTFFESSYYTAPSTERSYRNDVRRGVVSF